MLAFLLLTVFSVFSINNTVVEAARIGGKIKMNCYDENGVKTSCLKQTEKNESFAIIFFILLLFILTIIMLFCLFSRKTNLKERKYTVYPIKK